MEVKEYPQYLVYEDGTIWSKETTYPNLLNNPTKKAQSLKPRERKGGYQAVVLYKDGKPKAFSIHRLVAEAYIPNLTNFRVVNHKDGDVKNNHVSNLEWCSDLYNGQSFNKPTISTGHIYTYHGKRGDTYRGQVRFMGTVHMTGMQKTREEAEGKMQILIEELKSKLIVNGNSTTQPNDSKPERVPKTSTA